MAKSFLDLATEIGNLVEEKNRAYGDSFAKTGDFLRLLYPNGIPPEKYNDALCIVRIFDKLKRIATDKDALGESPYRDIAGYALLGLRMTEHDGLARFQTAHTMTPQEYVALRIPRTHSAPPPDATTLTAGDGGIDKGV